MSEVRTDRCPLCGGDNSCAMAASGGTKHLRADIRSGAGLGEQSIALAEARDIKGAAPTGIDIHQHRQGCRIGDALQIDQHILHGGDAQIGRPARTGGNAAPRQIQRSIAARLGKPRVLRRGRAHALQGPLSGNRLTKRLTGGNMTHDEGS